MPRKPKIRVSFYQDAQFLLRLGEAIHRDKTFPLSWRNEMGDRIKSLAVRLLNAPKSEAA